MLYGKDTTNIYGCRCISSEESARILNRQWSLRELEGLARRDVGRLVVVQ
jgi:hypothetical protein